METSADPSPTTSQRLVHGFLGLVGACVLYAASVGPVYVLSFSTGFPAVRTLNSFYDPLAFFADETSTRDFFSAYLLWWSSSCEPKEGYKFEPHGY